MDDTITCGTAQGSDSDVLRRVPLVFSQSCGGRVRALLSAPGSWQGDDFTRILPRCGTRQSSREQSPRRVWGMRRFKQIGFSEQKA